MFSDWRAQRKDDARDDQTEYLPSFYNDIDLERLPKADTPEQYGKTLRVARWGEKGLQRGIISPTRDSEVRKPASPKRTKIFIGWVYLKILTLKRY